MRTPDALMFGGLGKPTDDALRAVGPHIVNASFASDAADCPAHAALSLAFDDMRVGGMAKNLGNLWHAFAEARYHPEHGSFEEGLKAADKEFNETYERAEEQGLDKFLADYEKSRVNWFLPTAHHHETLLANGAFPGKTLAVEQEFWIVIGTPVDHDKNILRLPSYMILGKFDRILEHEDKLWIADWKTIDDNEDLPTWLEHRTITPQHNFYMLGLGMLVNERATLSMEEENILLEAPGFPDWPEEAGGWQYNFVRRGNFPQRATKDATKDERIAQWKEVQFATVPQPFDQTAAFMHSVGFLKFNQATFPFDPDFPLRNPKACRRWGKVRCNMWEPCINNVDPHLIDFLEPADSYVLDALDRSEALLDEEHDR